MGEKDAAEIGRLSGSIHRIMPALEEFNRFRTREELGEQPPRWMGLLDQPLPREGAGLDEVLRDLVETVIPDGVRIGAPGFCGWVTTAPTTSGTAAALAATVAGSQRYWMQPFHFLETVALRWLAELLGLPGDLQGIFTSGGSVANLVGLGAARQMAFEGVGLDPSRDGLPPDRRWRIYASTEVHHVVTRAAAVLGLGRRSVAAVAVDGSQRMDLDDLRRNMEADRTAGVLPVALVATSGTVNTGAVDPLKEMADIAEEHGVWFHVDGAYGLFGLLDPRTAVLFEGVERADSVAVDPHKWMAAPIGCGAVFVRDRELLGRTFTLEPADYLEGSLDQTPFHSPFDVLGEPYHNFNVEQSAPSRGVRVWAILKEIGARGMMERVVRHNDYARRLAERVEKEENLELLAEPVLSICCFRYRPAGSGEDGLDDLNSEIARLLRAGGVHVPSTTRVGGRLAIRPCYINPRTTAGEVDGLADAVLDIGDRLLQRRGKKKG
jgi:aromatic-L-amino-acid decarboxylase